MTERLVRGFLYEQNQQGGKYAQNGRASLPGPKQVYISEIRLSRRSVAQIQSDLIFLRLVAATKICAETKIFTIILQYTRSDLSPHRVAATSCPACTHGVSVAATSCCNLSPSVYRPPLFCCKINILHLLKMVQISLSPSFEKALTLKVQNFNKHLGRLIE